ncbi:unnamed protein product [Cochlearia groenlandica]
MEKMALYGLVIMLIYLVHGGYSQGEMKWMSEETKWDQLLTKTKLPIVVTVTSFLCGVPCAILEEQVAQVAKTNDNHVVFYNAGIFEKSFFAKRYNVLRVPTLLVFKDGIELKRLDKDFYWGVIYDLIFKGNIFDSAPPPTNSAAPSPSDFGLSPPFERLVKWIRDESQWNKILVKIQLPIVVTVTVPSSLCGGSCAIIEEQVDKLAETNDQIVFYTTNILEQPFFARLYNVLNVPTVIIFKDGEEIVRFEKLSDWARIGELISESCNVSFAPSPLDSASPLASQSGE